MIATQVFTKEEFERFQEIKRSKEYEEFEAFQRFKNDPGATSTPNANVLHGLNPSGTLGLFGSPGVDPRMYATIVRANGSWSSALPVLPSQFLQERREIITGINAATGTNPANFCGDGMKPGDMKICRQDYEFGDLLADTQNVDLINTGAYWNRADQNRDIIPPQVQNAPFMPDVLSGADVNSITYKQFLQLGTNLSRSSETVLVQGNKLAPANGAGSQPFYIHQPDGIDRMIKTGYVDVVSGVACSAVDSRVRNFGSIPITASAAEGTIVDYVTDLYTGIEMDLGDNGMGYSIDSSSWAILMHPRAWRPLTRQWPCAYQTTGCNIVANDGHRLNISAETQRQMQDDMYLGKYLMIDGIRIPVLFSWGVPAAVVAPDTYNSSLYMVPMRLNGAAVTFIEYFDVGNAYQNEFAGLVGTTDTRVINGGMFRLGRQDQPFCITYKVAGKWRLRFDAPFAAGRIDNVQFADRTRMRSPMPGESYYADGGQTARNNLF